jgi:hypothetical protein
MNTTIKYILLLPLLLHTAGTYAQRDPQWLMPLYFQDANGDRDTVYFGYDPEASTSCVDLDEFLGEVWITIDTSKFNVFLWAYPCDVGGTFSELHTKMVRKVDIRLDYIGTYIGFCKGKLPITMKWVDSLLYAPSCPYPDISPRPRARIDLTCYAYEAPYFSCLYNDDTPQSLTDYPAPEIGYPVLDSMFWDGSGMYPPSEIITHTTLNLIAHNYVYDVLDDHINSMLKIYPNPFRDELTIEIPPSISIGIQIISPDGQIVYQGYNDENLTNINTSGFSKGIYIVVLHSNEFVFSQKIVKTE